MSSIGSGRAEVDREVDRGRGRERPQAGPGRREPGVREHRDGERVQRPLLPQTEPAADLGVLGAAEERRPEAVLEHHALDERRRRDVRHAACARRRRGRLADRRRASARRPAAGSPTAVENAPSARPISFPSCSSRPLTEVSVRPARSTVVRTVIGPCLGRAQEVHRAASAASAPGRRPPVAGRAASAPSRTRRAGRAASTSGRGPRPRRRPRRRAQGDVVVEAQRTTICAVRDLTGPRRIVAGHSGARSSRF